MHHKRKEESNRDISLNKSVHASRCFFFHSPRHSSTVKNNPSPLVFFFFFALFSQIAYTCAANRKARGFDLARLFVWPVCPGEFFFFSLPFARKTLAAFYHFFPTPGAWQSGLFCFSSRHCVRSICGLLLCPGLIYLRDPPARGTFINEIHSFRIQIFFRLWI